MVACAMYNHEGWTDFPRCVPTDLASLCIEFNDFTTLDERSRLITWERLLAPVGADQSPEAVQEREEICLKAAGLTREEMDEDCSDEDIVSTCMHKILIEKGADAVMDMIMECCKVGSPAPKPSEERLEELKDILAEWDHHGFETYYDAVLFRVWREEAREAYRNREQSHEV